MTEKLEWNLVADIGGTNARFAIVVNNELLNHPELNYRVDEFPQLYDLIELLLIHISEQTAYKKPPSKVCFAVACPANQDRVEMTNSHWVFSQNKLKKQLKCQSLTVINDFAAVAHAVNGLPEEDTIQVGGGRQNAGKPVAIVGAGTGLGVAGLIFHGSDYSIVEGEGGHVDFAPVDELQTVIYHYIKNQFGHVSVERLLSGEGLANIYQAICHNESKFPTLSTPGQITQAAVNASDSLALKTLHVFCEVMGAVAGNLALTLGARGGVYIAGGIVPRFHEFFIMSQFRQRFEDKGRFNKYLQSIPVYLVTRDNIGLLGAAKNLASN